MRTRLLLRREYFDPVDLRILHIGCECNVDLAVGDFNGNSFDVGTQWATCFDPGIEILEVMTLDVERKDSLPRTGDAFVSLTEMKLHDVFPIRDRIGE